VIVADGIKPDGVIGDVNVVELGVGGGGSWSMGLREVEDNSSEPAGPGSVGIGGRGSEVCRCEGISPKLLVCEGISLVGEVIDADGMRPVIGNRSNEAVVKAIDVLLSVASCGKALIICTHVVHRHSV